jgi:hypothetical protein
MPQQMAPNTLLVSTATGIPLPVSTALVTPPQAQPTTAPLPPVSTAQGTITAPVPPQHQLPDSADKPPYSNDEGIGEASSLHNAETAEPEMEKPLPQRIIPDSLPVPPPDFIHTDTGTKVKTKNPSPSSC